MRCCRATSRRGPACSASKAAAPPAGRYRWTLVVDAPGLSDRHDLGAITVFADQAAAVADAESARRRRPAGHHLSEGTAVDQWLCAPRWCGRPRCAAHPRPGGRRAADRRGGDRRGAGGRTIHGGGAAVGRRRACRPARSWGGFSRARARTASDRATLAAGVAEAQASAEAARADLARAERLLAERAVPARRVEEAQRAVKVAEARLTAAQARLDQRDETLRTGGGAAAGNSFVLRAPIAGPRGGVLRRSARPTTKVRRCSGSCGPTASSFRRTSRRPRRRSTRAIAEIALEIPGRGEPVVVKAGSHARCRRHRSRHACAAGAVRRRQPDRPAAHWPDRDRRSSITGARQRMPTVPKEAVLMEAGRPYVFVQTGGESFARRYHRDRQPAMAISSACAAASSRASASSPAAPTTSSSRPRPAACRRKGTCTDRSG